MGKTIINIPVKDLSRSKDFFSKLGFEIDTNLSDDNALCLAINKETIVALLPNEHFAEATKSNTADTTSTHEVLISIPQTSEQTIDKIMKLALQNGGTEIHKPIRLKHIYGRSFSDLDGHQWNLFYELT